MATVVIMSVGCASMQREFLPANADTVTPPIQTHLQTAGQLVATVMPTPLGETVGEILSGLGVLAGTFAAWYARKAHAQSSANAQTLAGNPSTPPPPKV
jgi:hypothetical protein